MWEFGQESGDLLIIYFTTLGEFIKQSPMNSGKKEQELIGSLHLKLTLITTNCGSHVRVGNTTPTSIF